MAGFLIFDVESVPDGDFIARNKYPTENLDSDKAIRCAETDAKADSNGRSDFISLTYHVPIAVGLARLDDDFALRKLTVLNGTEFDITSGFWRSYGRSDVVLVSFNGRTFDLPLLELMAFKHGITIPHNYWGKYGPRNRFSDAHIDLMELVGNFGAYRVAGGLSALAQLLGRSGKVVVDEQMIDGKQVRRLHSEGRQDEINAYCIRDVLDAYAVLLRTRVMMGQLALDQETALLARAAEHNPG